MKLKRGMVELMRIDKTIYTIFKKGSKTYFYSTIFFPKAVKKDVFTLYSFLRKADDYVDSIPRIQKDFMLLKNVISMQKRVM